MQLLSTKKISAYREHTFRTSTKRRIKTLDESINFVNERGYIFFWPIKDITFPSLWVATAGNRPVADNHDDPGHITWQWKDKLLGSDKWYYAKVLRKRATLISMEFLPYFYALSENYGSIEEDHLILYEQGRLTQEAKLVYQALLDEGPLDTLALKKAAHLSSPENNSRFEKALADLQSDFKITPIRVSEAGSWRYAFVYDITARFYLDLLDRSRYISDEQGRFNILRMYFNTLAAARYADMNKLFNWKIPYLMETVQHLIKAEIIDKDILVAGPNPWYALRSILD